MKTIRKLNWMFILLLLGWATVTQAQTRVNWSGNVNGQTFNSDTQVTLTGDVYLKGTIYVADWKTLTIRTTGNYTIYRSGFNGWMFRKAGDNRCHFDFDGGEYTITIDGGAVYNTPNDARSGFKNGKPSKYGRAIWCDGHLTMNKVVVQNCYHPGESGFIDLENNSTTSSYNCKITNCIFQGNYGGNVFFMEGSDNHKISLENVTFQYNEATDGQDPYEACIRTYGSVRSSLKIKDCKLIHNKTLGGAIHWNAGGSVNAQCNIYGNTEIAYNESLSNNGGICNCGIMNISSAKIHDNIAAKDGGGVRMSAYTGGLAGFSGDGFTLTISDSVRIYNNQAGGYGGGVCLEFNPTPDVGYNPSGTAITANFLFQITGGEIYNNKATAGGGIYIKDYAPRKVYYTGSGHNGWSGEYVRNVRIAGGKVYDNYTWAGANNGDDDIQYGGAIAIKRSNINNITYTQDFGSLTVEMTGGELYQNHAYNGAGTASHNGAGGGMFVWNDYDPSTYSTECNVSVGGTAQIYGNTCDSYGAGIYLDKGNFTMTGGTIGKSSSHNVAAIDGGGYCVLGGTVNVNGGVINYNDAGRNGGGFYVSVPNNTDITTIMNGTTIAHNTAVNGAGAYISQGVLVIQDAATNITSNTATTSGGGIYMANGTVTYTNAKMQSNTATNNDGGGLYLGDGNITVSGESSAISGNTAKNHGGGLYVGGGTATLNGGSISSNSVPNGSGGGIYMGDGTCTVSGGTIGGSSPSDGNSAMYGGGIYSADGDITVNGGNIDYNSATDGGGLYDEGGTVVFTDGNINLNHASNNGGGIYVDTEGVLYLKGDAVLSRNNVPKGKDGGGVYLKGTVVVGDNSGAECSILAEDNFAATTSNPATYVPTRKTRNNIYLPVPVANPEGSATHRDVITVIENGIGLASHVGFSVPRNHVPVIYCKRSDTSWDYLDRFTTGPDHDLNTRLFDDTERYLSLHYTGWPEAFDPDHVYLYGFWPDVVTSLADVPGDGFTVDDNTVTIKNEEGFAWLISYVNGLNHSDPHTSSDLVVNLEADLNMEEYGWVPIGFKGVPGVDPQPFNGTFNGNGHIIEGVNGMVYGQDTAGVVDYGLFGYVTGGLIQDVFVHDMIYFTDNNGSLILGGLVGENEGGILCNSEVKSKLFSQSAQTLMGGLVGKQDSGILHSSIGIADMTGGRMGGLIGENSGALYNCFANANFTSIDDSEYYGGLVATNYGPVENCYMRIRPESDNPSGNFGFLVGDNKEEYGEVKYCYVPANKNPFYANNKGIFQGYGDYGDTKLPYLYCHRDTQLSLKESTNGFVGDADKQMLVALNNWVNEMSTDDMAYTKWGRPWHESNDLKPLNNDFPILRMPSAEAVAAKDGDPYLYFNTTDTLLAKYKAADEAIWMYNNSESVNGTNDDSSAKLYIAENVAMINSNPLKAYVGITLDNSADTLTNPTYFDVVDATDWHMISTPLRDAPVGINYHNDNTQYGFSYGHPSGMPYYRFYPEGDTMHGYFPSHRFDATYSPVDNSATAGGNYYVEWDFYSYDEPQYHWINFKRNSASHWHMDDPDHEWPLTYENEERLVPGKGYFAATREETFLQCYGTLNYTNNVFYNLTQTSGVPRHGYNLLGNPYQAYLDFDAFAAANYGNANSIWDTLSMASYTILDEDSARYVTFAYRGSDNPAYAGRYIHPHQGFFVQLRDRETAMATFNADMRDATAEDVKFRSNGHLNYPLVNLYVKENDGTSDLVTVELGRPDTGGAPMMKGLRTGNGKIWCRYNDADYSIAYTQPGVSEVGIRFETVEDTEYTLRWDTQNGEFSYLHLIDNMTGADVDCLSENSYKFNSRTSDYTSRFRLVFGYTGIEEDTETATMQDFAFMMGDELVVTGEGMLQVFDINGRMVTSRELHGVQSTVSLPNVSNGVYVLRLTEGKQSRVQKMVISK